MLPVSHADDLGAALRAFAGPAFDPNIPRYIGAGSENGGGTGIRAGRGKGTGSGYNKKPPAHAPVDPDPDGDPDPEAVAEDEVEGYGGWFAAAAATAGGIGSGGEIHQPVLVSGSIPSSSDNLPLDGPPTGAGASTEAETETEEDALPLLGGIKPDYQPPNKHIIPVSWGNDTVSSGNGSSGGSGGSSLPHSTISPLGYEEAERRGCDMHPPFILVAFHQGGNLAKYSRDGCFLSFDTLFDEVQDNAIPGVTDVGDAPEWNVAHGESKHKHRNMKREDKAPPEPVLEYRSMVQGPYGDIPNALYVTNGAKGGPQILVYGTCGKHYPVLPKHHPKHSDSESSSSGTPSGAPPVGHKEAQLRAGLGPITHDNKAPSTLGRSRELIRVITGKHQPKASGIHKRFRHTFQLNPGANHCYAIALDIPPKKHSLRVQNVTVLATGSDTVTSLDVDTGLNTNTTTSTNTTTTAAAQAQTQTLEETHSGHIFASFQHTDVVLWFDFFSLQEKALPMALAQETLGPLSKPYYPGTFHQFGNPIGGRMPKGLWRIGLMRLEGVRGLSVVKSKRGTRKLWVANEDVYGLMVFNVLTGLATDVLPLGGQPISLYHNSVESGGDGHMYVTISGWHLNPPHGGKCLCRVCVYACVYGIYGE